LPSKFQNIFFKTVESILERNTINTSASISPELELFISWYALLSGWNSSGRNRDLNIQPPSDAVRKQKKIFQWIFSVQYCHIKKNITPLET